MSEPTTEAGRRVMEYIRDDLPDEYPMWLGHIRAIEAQARTEALDVEVLAEALNNTVGKSGWLRLTPSDAVSEWVANAEVIAAEYARLTREEGT